MTGVGGITTIDGGGVGAGEGEDELDESAEEPEASRLGVSASGSMSILICGRRLLRERFASPCESSAFKYESGKARFGERLTRGKSSPEQLYPGTGGTDKLDEAEFDVSEEGGGEAERDGGRGTSTGVMSASGGISEERLSRELSEEGVSALLNCFFVTAADCDVVTGFSTTYGIPV